MKENSHFRDGLAAGAPEPPDMDAVEQVLREGLGQVFCQSRLGDKRHKKAVDDWTPLFIERLRPFFNRSAVAETGLVKELRGVSYGFRREAAICKSSGAIAYHLCADFLDAFLDRHAAPSKGQENANGK